jgi:predicted nucleic acid-binding Zn ribbon protein
MKSTTKTGEPRRCLQCGKPILYRRSTAKYCTSKCNIIFNYRKRKAARQAAGLKARDKLPKGE